MFDLSPKGTDYLQRARSLGPLIDESADAIEAARDLPPPLFAALRKQDMFRLVQPEAYGGAEMDPPSLVQIIEELALHDASTAWCVGQTNICAYTAAFLEPATVKEVFGPDTGILAWGPGPGQARAVAGGYRLTGQFDFASGSRLATWLGANVAVVEADGQTRRGEDGKPLTHTLIFPKSNASVRDTWHVMGLRGTGSDSYAVTDLLVPESYCLPRHPRQKPAIGGDLYTFSASMLYASCFAAISLGVARSVMQYFVTEMRDTTSRGAAKSRGDNNVIQTQVAQSEARLRSARMFLFTSISETWLQVQGGKALTLDQQITIRMSSTWATQAAKQVVADLYGLSGAIAIFTSRPLERRFRDIHTITQQIQGHMAHFETIGQILLGRAPDRPMFTF